MPFLFFSLITADQVTKLLVVIFAQKINLPIIHNTGVAFGMLGEKSSLVLLITASLLLLLYVFKNIFFFNNIWHKYSLICILSGGTSNLIDRLIHGYVIDFIKIPFIPYFNLADILINIGMALYVLGLIVNKNESNI